MPERPSRVDGQADNDSVPKDWGNPSALGVVRHQQEHRGDDPDADGDHDAHVGQAVPAGDLAGHGFGGQDDIVVLELVADDLSNPCKYFGLAQALPPP